MSWERESGMTPRVSIFDRQWMVVTFTEKRNTSLPVLCGRLNKCLNLLLPQAPLKWQWRNEKGINPQPQRVWERGKNQMRDVNQTVEHRWRRGSLFSRVEKATIYRKESQQETSLFMLRNLRKVQQLETPCTWEIQSEGRGKMRTSAWKSNIMSS